MAARSLGLPVTFTVHGWGLQPGRRPAGRHGVPAGRESGRAEAMRAGLPVIASNVGGVPESVHDGRTGIVIPPRDVRAATAGLDQLLSSGALRQQMGLAGRRSFEEQFTFDKMVDATVAVYREAIEARRPAGGYKHQ